MGRKIPNLGPDLGKIYKRTDWPPPDFEVSSTFKGIWDIKHPTLRAIRLKILYKDVFSNERRYRFGISDSPLCASCGQIESVDHHLFSCRNAIRIWNLFQRLTRNKQESLFDVVRCDLPLEIEIIKTVLIKALLQVDRSSTMIEKAMIMDCVFYLKIEATVNRAKSRLLREYAERLISMV